MFVHGTTQSIPVRRRTLRGIERNKAAILQKMQLKYNTTKGASSNSASRRHHTTLSLNRHHGAEDSEFSNLFLDSLTLQYMSGNFLEGSQPIQDALDISQEAEDAIRASRGDGTECRQVILSLEDILLRIFEDEDIQSAHSQGLLRSVLIKCHIGGNKTWNNVMNYRNLEGLYKSKLCECLVGQACRMVATEWTSKEQKEWLTSHLPSYSKCSTKASYAKFWPPVYEQWEQKWPTCRELWPDLPEDEVLSVVQSDIMGKAFKKHQKVHAIS
ncbi:hypothetical protein F4604DRAFT_1677415 [Suillus subluteus]|nr:hypothetical protein F4604DRAFT_1677415 [Suillus subluteus]